MSGGKVYPKHPAYDKNTKTYEPQTPSFGFFLPPDMTFLIFPFSEDDARHSGSNPGKYFIIEEPVGELGFGLDLASANTFSYENLSWEDFGIDEQSFGGYATILESEEILEDDKKLWNVGTSAFRAAKTFQKPYRIAIHADQMLPDEE